MWSVYGWRENGAAPILFFRPPALSFCGTKLTSMVVLWRAEKLYRVDCILSAARFQLCGAKLASMVGYRRAGKLCRTDFILSAARAQFLRDKTGECGRFVANEKTVPYRFSSVGRLLLVLQGTTGEKAVLWRTEKLYRVDFIFPAARPQFCGAKLASMVGLWLAGKLCRVDFLFPAARFQFCKAKLARSVSLWRTGKLYRIDFIFPPARAQFFACQQMLQGVRQLFPIRHHLDKIIDTACIR